MLGSEKEIINELKFCLKMLETEKNRDIKFALYSYIENLEGVLKNLGRDFKIKRKDIFKNKREYQKFKNRFNLYEKNFVSDFCYYKDVHSDYLNEILVRIEPLFYEKIEGCQYSQQSNVFSKDEFITIFHDFCEELGIAYLFDSLIDKKIISFDMKNCDSKYYGLMLHNPLNGNSHVLVNNFSYNVDSMFTLVHEMGHVYDTECFDSASSVSKYNKYMYNSLNIEVISKLFENLLLDYLIKNNIKKEVAIDKLIDDLIIGHDNMFSTYIISLLNDEYIEKDRYKDISNDHFSSLVSKYINSKSGELNNISNYNLDLIDDIVYTYGDIISLFLKEYVSSCKLSNSLEFNKFMKERFEDFSDEFIISNGFSPKKYEKLYKKRLELVKK